MIFIFYCVTNLSLCTRDSLHVDEVHDFTSTAAFATAHFMVRYVLSVMCVSSQTMTILKILVQIC